MWCPRLLGYSASLHLPSRPPPPSLSALFLSPCACAVCVWLFACVEVFSFPCCWFSVWGGGGLHCCGSAHAPTHTHIHTYRNCSTAFCGHHNAAAPPVPPLVPPAPFASLLSPSLPSHPHPSYPSLFSYRLECHALQLARCITCVIFPPPASSITSLQFTLSPRALHLHLCPPPPVSVLSYASSARVQTGASPPSLLPSFPPSPLSVRVAVSLAHGASSHVSAHDRTDCTCFVFFLLFSYVAPLPSLAFLLDPSPHTTRTR